ncbi:hypothetical protein T09_10587 [Trichinella sp. T9]|nr:hypothetical protein T09_10587 [Trichinella sp. T9]
MALLFLLWLRLLALWNSLVWSSGVCFVRPMVVGIGWPRISTIFLFHLLFRRSSIKRKKGLKITEDALNDSMRMKCEEIILPADLATLQWALVRKAMSTRCIGAWWCFTLRRTFQGWTAKRGQFN